MTGIILFRAQPFHNGHLAQIKRAYDDLQKLGGDLYIIIGSADKMGTKRNPLPISIRLDLVRNSLAEVYGVEDLCHIHVIPLEDLSDEANNTYSWGQYLYNEMCEITNDKDFIFYYSDKPEIALSWFDEHVILHFWFRFLPRVNDVNATKVRDCLLHLTDCQDNYDTLKHMLPSYVYSKYPEICYYIINAK